ncbi:MAG TPA: ribulose-phosphate 3-epimerase [Gemmatimonadaceae bacterium]|nr:ribulose-phosphate 3-epimerase [Gemmatimonadaceae bacterium]
MSVRIAPSVLSADFANLAGEVGRLESGGADWVHVDVMDGRFVPNLTFGAKVIDTLRQITNVPLDCHLMVVEPERYFEAFSDAGASVITIHAEASPHLHRQVARIKELGCIAGVAINPATPVETVREIAPDLDLLLIMTVNPGFGGQQFIPASVDKVRRARQLLHETGSRAALEVDGGITRETIGSVWRAGADTFVAGQAVFSSGDAAAEIRALRSLCAEQA